MVNREQLIMDLNRIKENNFILLEGESASQYVDSMLQYIGDPDPTLRDNLIYNTFFEWIYTKEYFSDDELRDILKIVIDENHLFFGIGNDGDESAFTRTFSVLVVALILTRHRKKTILDSDFFERVKNALLRYFEEEKDYRGYTEEEGWAHGAAHGADALDELIQCKESNEVIFQEVLNAIQKPLYNGKYLLCNEEDERLVIVIYKVIRKRFIGEQQIISWLEGLGECCEWENTRSRFIAKLNTKNFIRCLYFRLLHRGSDEKIMNALLTVESRLNRYHEVDNDL